METTVTLYGLARSVYTRIAALALIEKGVPWRLQEVEIFGPEGVPPDHLVRHPFGRIPVLAHGGFMLYETHAICRYVDEAFDGPPLQPTDVRARARMAQAIGVLDSYAYQPMVWGVFVQRVRVPMRGGVADEKVIAQALPKVEMALRALSSLLGDELTLASLHAYPMLAYLRLAREGREAIGRHAAIEQWLERMDARESVARTKTEYEPG